MTSLQADIVMLRLEDAAERLDREGFNAMQALPKLLDLHCGPNDETVMEMIEAYEGKRKAK
jgi:hypothetical protein